jgi:hypothetical protein
VGAAVLLAVSFVPAWLVHVRHLGGHGLTQLETTLNAWQSRAVPVLSAGVVLSLLGAALVLAPPRLPAWLPLAMAAAGLGLMAAAFWPVEQAGHASAVELLPGAVLLAGVVLAAALLALAVVALRPPPRLLPALATVAVAAALAGVPTRSLALNLAEGDPRHYSDGSYLGPSGELLTISDGTYRIGDRWAGTLEGRGLVASLDDDEACPDSRGSYRVFADGDEGDIRWEMIIDTCQDGERAAVLTDGTWERRP